MSFPFNVYLLVFISALLTTLAALPVWLKWCLRAGLVDAPGARKIHEHPIPLAGGLAVLTGLLVPLLAAAVAMRLHFFGAHVLTGPAVSAIVDYGFARRENQLGVILCGAVGMAVVGWLDDQHDLRPSVKFAGQLLIAVLVATAGVRITLFVKNVAFSYLVTVLWILTVTNACNFLDNMNGLCAGLGVIGSWCFAWTAAVDGQYLVTSIALLMCGAMLGFLPYNFPNAKAFLGDSGSHLIGYLLAILAILPHFYSRRNPDTMAVLKPLFILGVFLGDLVWVVILRWRLGRPVYLGDNNHISHRLLRRGLNQTQAVLIIWLLAGLLGWVAFRL